MILCLCVCVVVVVVVVMVVVGVVMVDSAQDYRFCSFIAQGGHLISYLKKQCCL